MSRKAAPTPPPMAHCPVCRPGLVCAPCIARFPRMYLPPGEERERALRTLREDADAHRTPA